MGRVLDLKTDLKVSEQETEKEKYLVLHLR